MKPSSPNQRMRIETSTTLPVPDQRGIVVVGAWPCGLGVGKSLVLFTAVILTSALFLLRYPPTPSSLHPFLRPPSSSSPPPVDPSLYTNFTSSLILQAGHEDWVSFDRSSAPHFFTPQELATLPPPSSLPSSSSLHSSSCEETGLPSHCCLGSFSLAGLMVWDNIACANANFLQAQVPHTSPSSLPSSSFGRFRDMGDVLRRLGNRTLTVWGDSVASQHAHAMECSWLRSGKAQTLHYEKQDFNRIFNKKEDGGGFNRAGTYGTNALYTWRTWTHPQTLPSSGGRKEEETKEEEKEEGKEGVEGTMKFYLTYRPVLNESGPIIEESDVLLVNFGLHYLIDKRAEFQEEMVALLRTLRAFGQTKGKQLIWRETSAQHHFNEGGEFPLTIAPERFGVLRKDYQATMDRCFPIHFGPYIHPQWRDKLFLLLARQEGWEVRFLGEYDGGGEGKGEREEREGGGEGGERVTEARRPRRRRGADIACGAQGKKKAAVVGVDGKMSMEEGGGGSEGGERPVLYWMPFYRITSERIDLHPYNEWKGKYDCTHYCYTPFLWDPLVDGLGRVVEEGGRKVAEEEEEEEGGGGCQEEEGVGR